MSRYTFINRADNYDFPAIAELRPDNVISVGSGYYVVDKVLSNNIEVWQIKPTEKFGHDFKPLSIISANQIRGVNLKAWIHDELVMAVIEALLLSNGFQKRNLEWVAFEYVKGGIAINNAGKGGWFMQYRGQQHYFSYLHELQNKHEDLTGVKLDIEGAY